MAIRAEGRRRQTEAFGWLGKEDGGGRRKPKNLQNFGCRYRFLPNAWCLYLVSTEPATLLVSLVVEVAAAGKHCHNTPVYHELPLHSQNKEADLP